LVAIDEDGNIVVVELKRDDSGTDVHWQAIKYASYWSRFTVQDVLEVYADYQTKHRQSSENKEFDVEDAKQEIIEFINQDSIENINKKQRIILVSHRFSKEVISAVHWLRENYGLDVRCIQLIPYYDADKLTFYLQSNIILPVAGIEEYLVNPSSGKAVAAKGSSSSRNDDEVTSFFENIRDGLRTDDSSLDAFRPFRHSRWAGSDYRFRYYHFWHRDSPWDNWHLSYMVWIYNDSATDKKYRNKARVFLSIDKNHLFEKGVTERQLEVLFCSLKETCDQDTELSFGETTGGWYWVETVLPVTTLDDTLRDLIKNTLIRLISATFTDVQKAIDIEGEEIEQSHVSDD